MFFSVPMSLIFLMLLCRALCHEIGMDDLTCFNDYDTEMKCYLSHILTKCSGYELKIDHLVLDRLNKYSCLFERSHHSSSICECKITMINGFVLNETFNTTLKERGNILFKKEFDTGPCIKPKTPAISVHKTAKGNFKVTWDTKYAPDGFAVYLHIILTIKEGEDKIIKSYNKSASLESYEIVSTYLQPNTKYNITARTSSVYNNHKILSDQSAPHEFITPPSPDAMLKTVIPAVCIGLIVIIFTLFICFIRVKKVWWDNISKPKMPYLTEQKSQMLPPSHPKFSPIHVEISKEEEKKWMISSSVDTINEESSKSVDSTQVVYAQTCSGSQEQNIISRTERALHEVFKFSSLTNHQSVCNNQVPVVLGRSIGFQKECNRISRDSGNCSGSSVFSNMSYLGSTDNSSFLEQLPCDQSYQSSNTKDSSPVFNDVDCLQSVDTENTQLKSPINNTIADGYQSFNEVSDKGNPKDVDCLEDNSVTDENAILKNLITSQNPLYPTLNPHDSSITTCDDGYQAFQSVAKSTEAQWSPTSRAELALGECGALKIPQTSLRTVAHCNDQIPTSLKQCSWKPPLHISPCIQIDSSYHSV